MRRSRKRQALGVAVLAALVAAFAVTASTVQAGSGLPTSIGKGEGQLNVIEWPYYTYKTFAKPFEKQTGCIIHRKDAGTSQEMFGLMHAHGGGGGGQYDLVSASGDASLRLIYAHDVKAINIKLIPSWKQFLPQFKSPAHNTVNGVHYGVSVQWGPNTFIYNTKKVKPAPTNWNLLYSKKYAGHITIPNNPIQIADAALYLEKTKPSLGIKDPYELTQAQLSAAVNLLKQQKPNLKRFWNYAADEDTSFKNGDVWLGAGWPYQTLQLKANHVPVKEIVPSPTTGWADTWMLASKAPHPNCAYMWMKYVTTPKVEAKQALVFGETPVNPLACKYMNKMQKGSCAGYHLNEPASYYSTIKFWKTPIPQCGWTKKQTCTDYNAWVQAWAQVTGRGLAADAGAVVTTGPPIRRARLRLSGFFWRRPWLRAVALLTPPLAAFLVVYVGSLGVLFISSLWTSNSFTAAIEHTWTFANYRTIFSTANPYLHVAGFTLKMAAGVTVTDAILAFPLAFFMARLAGKRTRALLFVMVLLPLWSSYLVRIYAWQTILAHNGAINWALNGIGLPDQNLAYTNTAMWIVYSYVWLPFMVLPVYAALERIPDSYLEASADLGARGWRTFRSVILPLSLPGVVAGSIFTFALTLGDYITPLLVGGTNSQMIGNFVYDNFATNLPFAAAFAVIPMAIMGVYLLIARRLGAFEAL